MLVTFLKTNEKGQVKAESSVLKQMEDLKEETGLVCCICREGYRYQPTKVCEQDVINGYKPTTLLPTIYM